jgi:hypothetical protein
MPNPLICRTCVKRLAAEELAARRCASCEERLARKLKLQDLLRARRQADAARQARIEAEIEAAKPAIRLYERLDSADQFWEAVARAYGRRKEEEEMREIDTQELDDFAREYAGRLRNYFRKAARILNRSSVRMGDDAQEPDDLILQQLLDELLEVEPDIFEEVERLDRRSEVTKKKQRQKATA